MKKLEKKLAIKALHRLGYPCIQHGGYVDTENIPEWAGYRHYAKRCMKGIDIAQERKILDFLNHRYELDKPKHNEFPTHAVQFILQNHSSKSEIALIG